MTIVFVVLAVILIFGSMLWVLPSPRQRQQMRMRQQAMQMGITVKLTRVDDYQFPGRTLPCIRYSIPVGRDDKKSKGWRIERTSIGWQGKGDAYRLPSDQMHRWGQKLESLTEGVLALEVTPIAVSLYWNEQGEEGIVQVVETFLQQVKAQGLGLVG